MLRNALNLSCLRIALRKIGMPRGAEGDWVEIGKRVGRDWEEAY